MYKSYNALDIMTQDMYKNYISFREFDFIHHEYIKIIEKKNDKISYVNLFQLILNLRLHNDLDLEKQFNSIKKKLKIDIDSILPIVFFFYDEKKIALYAKIFRKKKYYEKKTADIQFDSFKKTEVIYSLKKIFDLLKQFTQNEILETNNIKDMINKIVNEIKYIEENKINKPKFTLLEKDDVKEDDIKKDILERDDVEDSDSNSDSDNSNDNDNNYSDDNDDNYSDDNDDNYNDDNSDNYSDDNSDSDDYDNEDQSIEDESIDNESFDNESVEDKSDDSVNFTKTNKNIIFCLLQYIKMDYELKNDFKKIQDFFLKQNWISLYTIPDYVHEYQKKIDKKELLTIKELITLYDFKVPILTKPNISLFSVPYVFKKLKSDQTIPFIHYVTNQHVNDQVNKTIKFSVLDVENNYKIYDDKKLYKLYLSWIIRNEKKKKNEIWCKKLLNKTYKDIIITNKYVKFKSKQNNIKKQMDILQIQDDYYNHDIKPQNINITLTYNISKQFSLDIFLYIIYENKMFQNNIFIDDEKFQEQIKTKDDKNQSDQDQKETINDCNGLYLESFTKKIIVFKLSFENNTCLLSLKNININLLQTVKQHFFVLFKTYTEQYQEIKKKLIKIYNKTDKLINLSNLETQTSIQPRKNEISKQDYDRLKSKSNIYEDDLGHFVHPSYYLIHDTKQQKYFKIECKKPKKYINFVNLDRIDVTDFSCEEKEKKKCKRSDIPIRQQKQFDQIQFNQYKKFLETESFFKDEKGNYMSLNSYNIINEKKREIIEYNCQLPKHIYFINDKLKKRNHISDFCCIKSKTDTNTKSIHDNIKSLLILSGLQIISNQNPPIELQPFMTFEWCLHYSRQKPKDRKAKKKYITPDFSQQQIKFKYDHDQTQFNLRSFCGQETQSFLTLENIKELHRKGKYNHHFFIKMFSNYYSLNIIVFNSDTGKISLPKHKKRYIINKFYDETIFLLYEPRTNKYIVITDSNGNVIFKIKNIKYIIDYYKHHIQYLDLDFKIDKYKLDEKLYQNIKQIYQDLDHYGKCRTLLCQIISQSKIKSQIHKIIRVDCDPIEPLQCPILNRYTTRKNSTIPCVAMNVETQEAKQIYDDMKGIFNEKITNFKEDEKKYSWDVKVKDHSPIKFTISKKLDNISSLENFKKNQKLAFYLMQTSLYQYSKYFNQNKSQVIQIPDKLFYNRGHLKRDYNLFQYFFQNKDRYKQEYREQIEQWIIQSNISNINYKKYNEYPILNDQFFENNSGYSYGDYQIIIDNNEIKEKLKYYIRHNMIRNRSFMEQYWSQDKIKNYDIVNKQHFKIIDNNSLFISGYFTFMKHIIEKLSNKQNKFRSNKGNIKMIYEINK